MGERLMHEVGGNAFASIPEAIDEIARGRMVIVVDDADRENEGDLIVAAEKVTPETIAFMVRYTSGVICMPVMGERLDQLHIPVVTEVPGLLRREGAVEEHQRLDLGGKGPPACQDDGGGAASLGCLPSEPRAGFGLHDPSRRHGEPRHLTLRPVAILPSGEDPESRPGVAFEGQHRIHRVLERAWPGQVASLRDVADEEHGDPLLLGE